MKKYIYIEYLKPINILLVIEVFFEKRKKNIYIYKRKMILLTEY